MKNNNKCNLHFLISFETEMMFVLYNVDLPNGVVLMRQSVFHSDVTEVLTISVEKGWLGKNSLYNGLSVTDTKGRGVLR